MSSSATYFEWLTGFTQEQNFTLAIAVISALLGGLVSFLSALIVIKVSNNHQKHNAEKLKDEHKAELAFNGLQKMVETANIALNLKKLIDQSFSDFKEAGGDLKTRVAATYVVSRVGHRNRVPKLSFEETRLVSEIKDGLFLSKLNLIQQRVENNEVLMDEYSRLRFDLDEYQAVNAKSITEKEGLAAEFELVGNCSKIASLRLSRLNNLLGQLMDFVESDAAVVTDLTERFCAEANKHFDDKFPIKEIVWDTNNLEEVVT